MTAQLSTETENQLVRHARRLLGDPVLSWKSLHGGDLSEVIRLELTAGKDVVAKSGPYPDREARMLRKLADAGANVPRPIASNAHVLVLEDLGKAASPNDQAWRALGAALRALHTDQGHRYGWDEDYAFGPVRIHNGWSDVWSDFWYERRLAADIEALPKDIARTLEKLQSRIKGLLPDRPPHSLLHGDLWSGNVHFTATGDAYLIDPASYYGHAEVDLAMLTLFGSPPKVFWTAYGALDDGWERRRYAYQLWPALVHLRLFGSVYRSLVERLLAALSDQAENTRKTE
jgi:fructosamine-3-kinase